MCVPPWHPLHCLVSPPPPPSQQALAGRGVVLSGDGAAAIQSMLARHRQRREAWPQLKGEADAVIAWLASRIKAFGAGAAAGTAAAATAVWRLDGAPATSMTADAALETSFADGQVMRDLPERPMSLTSLDASAIDAVSWRGPMPLASGASTRAASPPHRGAGTAPPLVAVPASELAGVSQFLSPQATAGAHIAGAGDLPVAASPAVAAPAASAPSRAAAVFAAGTAARPAPAATAERTAGDDSPPGGSTSAVGHVGDARKTSAGTVAAAGAAEPANGHARGTSGDGVPVSAPRGGGSRSRVGVGQRRQHRDERGGHVSAGEETHHERDDEKGSSEGKQAAARRSESRRKAARAASGRRRSDSRSSEETGLDRRDSSESDGSDASRKPANGTAMPASSSARAPTREDSSSRLGVAPMRPRRQAREDGAAEETMPTHSAVLEVSVARGALPHTGRRGQSGDGCRGGDGAAVATVTAAPSASASSSKLTAYLAGRARAGLPATHDTRSSPARRGASGGAAWGLGVAEAPGSPAASSGSVGPVVRVSSLLALVNHGVQLPHMATAVVGGEMWSDGEDDAVGVLSESHASGSHAAIHSSGSWASGDGSGRLQPAAAAVGGSGALFTAFSRAVLRSDGHVPVMPPAAGAASRTAFAAAAAPARGGATRALSPLQRALAERPVRDDGATGARGLASLEALHRLSRR